MKTQWEEQGKGNDPKRPACHLLSNGSYSVLLTGDGGGWSQCDGVRLTNNRDGIAVMIRYRSTDCPGISGRQVRGSTSMEF